MMRAPVVAVCLEGVDCIEAVRLLCGETLARKAPAGTIRGDLGRAYRQTWSTLQDSAETAPGSPALLSR